MAAAASRSRTRFRLLVAAIVPLLLIGAALTPALSEPDPQEAAILIKFRDSLESATELKNWGGTNASTGKVCNGNSSSWKGVKCTNNEVTGLKLEGMGLRGSVDVDTLSRLKNLRAFSLMNNSFSGPIPDVRKLGHLRNVYLSFNRFSGEIPEDGFSGLNSMRRVVMADNELEGKIPGSLTKLPRLVDLQLQNNVFDGEIPDFQQEGLVVNLANNKLEGPIPSRLQTQNSTSLQGNNLCGRPMDPCPKKKSSMPKFAVILIAVGGAVITLVAILTATLLCRRSRTKTLQNKKPAKELILQDREAPVRKGRAAKVADQNEEKLLKKKGDHHEHGNLHFLTNNGRQKFEMEDLLRASAEVLGSGNFGSSYKADLVDGPSLVVKRFKQMSNVGKEQFFEHMRRLGNLSHPNILPLVAFYYRKEEKLVVTDLAELGSLAGLLHGRRSSKQPGLDWPTRLNIIKGVAKGLAYLYEELPTLNLPHGHLKSSNVLLHKNFEPILADYALTPLINRDHAQQFMVAYKSPEFMHHNQVTRKTDVWSLGILTLEMLTGRFPANYLKEGMNANADLLSWVNSVVREEWTGEVFDKEMGSTRNGEGQMLKLLRIGMCCCEKNVEKRWDLREAVERIEELKKWDVDDIDYCSSYGSEEDMNSSSRGLADGEFSISLSVAEKSVNLY